MVIFFIILFLRWTLPTANCPTVNCPRAIFSTFFNHQLIHYVKIYCSYTSYRNKFELILDLECMIFDSYAKKCSLNSEQHFFSAPIFLNNFLHMFQMILRKNKFLRKKWKNIFRHFFNIFFAIFLESSETYVDPSLNEIGP